MSYTGADLIAQGLADLGVEHVFGIVSIHNMPIFDAINRLGKTKIIDVRHEQAGTHAADGYARTTGGFGVMIASTGPGTSNTVTGLYEAEYASSRVLVITGQAETKFYGKALGYVHEAEKQVPMLQAVCRRVESPRHIDRLGDALDAVVRDMFTGRPAPAALEVPIDLQYAETEQRTFKLPEPAAFPADEKTVEQIAKRIQKAGRRVIVAGGGVVSAGAGKALTALAERLDCPVFTTSNGRGAIPEDHPLSLGNYYTSAGMYQAINDADPTIAIGTRFAVGVDGQQARLTPPGDLIQIDVEPQIIARTHHAEIGLNSDALAALTAIDAALTETTINDAQFNQSVLEASEGVRGAMRARLGEDFPRIMDKLRAALPRGGSFVRDQTISAYNWGNQQFPIYEPRTTMNPTSGAIGPGLPLAVGAAVASGEKTVLILGDGGFMFHATELATVAQYQLPLVVCVFNDQGYGVLRWLQDTRFGRINETDLGKVDFAMMAQSMGVPGERVADVASFEAAVDKAMDVSGPYLIEVDMEQFAPMEISIMPKKKA